MQKIRSEKYLGTTFVKYICIFSIPSLLNFMVNIFFQEQKNADENWLPKQVLLASKTSTNIKTYLS